MLLWFWISCETKIIEEVISANSIRRKEPCSYLTFFWGLYWAFCWACGWEETFCFLKTLLPAVKSWPFLLADLSLEVFFIFCPISSCKNPLQMSQAAQDLQSGLCNTARRQATQRRQVFKLLKSAAAQLPQSPRIADSRPHSTPSMVRKGHNAGTHLSITDLASLRRMHAT